MVLELATVLLAACVGAVAVLYAAPKGYLGHRKKAKTPAPPAEHHAPTTEQVPEVPAKVAPTAAEPAPPPEPEPAPAPAFYETVQPAPAPVTFSAQPSSFGTPALAKKPTRTYRRRTAPVRSAGAKKTLKPKEE